MRISASAILLIVITALSTLGGLSACGQKGPLIMPQDNSEQAPAK